MQAVLRLVGCGWMRERLDELIREIDRLIVLLVEIRGRLIRLRDSPPD